MRQRKKPTRQQVQEENEALRDALEQIADILEDAGIIDGDEPYADDLGERDSDDDDIIPGEAVVVDEGTEKK